MLKYRTITGLRFFSVSYWQCCLHMSFLMQLWISLAFKNPWFMMNSWAEIVEVQVVLTMYNQATEGKSLSRLPLCCPQSPVFTTGPVPSSSEWLLPRICCKWPKSKRNLIPLWRWIFAHHVIDTTEELILYTSNNIALY